MYHKRTVYDSCIVFAYNVQMSGDEHEYGMGFRIQACSLNQGHTLEM